MEKKKCEECGREVERDPVLFRPIDCECER